MGWYVAYEFPGKPSYEEMNQEIRLESGDGEPFFADKEDYEQAVREGMVRYDGSVTTIWAEDMR